MDGKSNPSPAVNSAVKAAAWAWYQHGSGASDSLSTAREYDVTRRLGANYRDRPSRFKLEAERRGLELFDAYEIDQISRHLDSLVARSGVGHGKFSDDESVASMTSSFSTASTSSWSSAARKAVRGFWLRRAATVCGTRDGGVVNAMCRSVSGRVRHSSR